MARGRDDARREGREKVPEFRQGASALPRVLQVVASPEGTTEYGYVDRILQGLLPLHPGGLGVALPEGDPMGEVWKANGVHLHRVSLRTSSPKATWELTRILRSEGYSLVHSHGRFAGLHARLASSRAGASSLHSFHGLRQDGLPLSRRLLYQGMERVLASRSAYLVCLTQGEKEQAIRQHLGDPQRTIVIPDGVDLSRLSTLPPRPLPGHQEGAVAIGSAGRLTTWRRPEMAARLFVSLLKRGVNARFYWLDDGGFSHQAARDAVSEALSGNREARERFTVVAAGENVVGYLHSLNLFVSTSIKEDFPYWGVTALALGKASLLSSCPGNVDLAAPGKSALYFDPENEKEGEALLHTLATNPGMGERLAPEARIRAAERFSQERLTEAMGNLYRRFGEGGIKPQSSPILSPEIGSFS